jgi:hypothetical protein
MPDHNATLRVGSGNTPPTSMRTNELAYSPSDHALWLLDNAGQLTKLGNGNTGGGGGGIQDPPNDGFTYGRSNGTWTRDHSNATVTSPAVISVKPTLSDLTSAFKPFDFFGGKASNADNLAALNNWVAYGGPVLIPAGRFVVSATPNQLTNKPAAIVGLGNEVSLFVFAAGANGLSISQDSYTHPTHLRDFSLLTQSTTDFGTALTYVDAGTDIYNWRFPHRLSLQRIGVRGDATRTQGWGTGFNLTNPQVTLLDTLVVTGRNDSTIENTRAGYGHMTACIALSGTSEITTDIDMRSCRLNNAQTGVSVRGYLEGLRINGGLINNVWRGVDAQLSSTRPGFNVDGIHANVFDYAIYMSNVVQAKITNNLFYKHPAATTATVAVGLVNGCSIISVEGNQAINQTTDYATGGGWTFATVADSSFIDLRDNEIERPSGVIVFSGTTVYSNEWNNAPLGSLAGASFAQFVDTSSGGSSSPPTNLFNTSTFPLASNSVSSSSGQFYAVPHTGPCALWYCDGTVSAFLDAPSPSQPFSSHRPFSWNLVTGGISLAGTGESLVIGGNCSMTAGDITLFRDPVSNLHAATKQYVDNHVGGGAGIAGVTAGTGLTGGGTSGTVTLSATYNASAPTMDGTANAGVANTLARSDHAHPTDTSRYAATNPSGYQTAANVTTSLAPYAPLASPTFTGAPAAPTASANDNTTKLATTAYVIGQASGTTPLIDGTAAAGSALVWARGDHVHPTDTSRYAATNPSGYQTAAQVAAAVVASTGTPVAFGIDFSQGAVVVNGTIIVIQKAPFALTINSMDYAVGSAGGSFTVAVKIAGTNVTGLSAVAVSSATSANAAATAANTVTAGQTITVVISATTGSPTGGNLQINGTR